MFSFTNVKKMDRKNRGAIQVRIQKSCSRSLWWRWGMAGWYGTIFLDYFRYNGGNFDSFLVCMEITDLIYLYYVIIVVWFDLPTWKQTKQKNSKFVEKKVINKRLFHSAQTFRYFCVKVWAELNNFLLTTFSSPILILFYATLI